MADSSFEREFLQTHNTYRKQHGATPLTINRDLCRSAQAWAEHLLSIKTLKHSNADYGENLYYAWSSSPKKLIGHEAVDSWYSEIKDYNFKKPGFTSGTGHFTQVVWKDTKEVGFGVATDGATIFVVGQYLPAGNISNPGYFEKNVLPSGSPVDIKSTTSGPAGGSGQAPGGLSIQPNKIPSHSGLAEKGSSENKNSSFEREFLQTHNTYRKQHGAPPLTINHDLCRSAQAWAENLLSIKTLKHSKADYGENLYYAWSSSPKKLTGHEAVDSWYSEIKDYNFKKPGFTSGTGHFTQVVWKDTKEVGFGVATDGATIFVVGQYLPAGNISNPGYFEKNVLPSGSPVDIKSTTSGPAGGSGQAPGGLSIQPNKIPSHSGLAEKGSSENKNSSFEREFLQTHNTYRKQHGAPPLTINHDLCRSAQAWAENLLSIKTLKHSKADYGENLYYAWSSSPKKLTGHEAVDSWYSEIKDYNFKKPGFTSGTGHFTQVVWKDTKEVGFGVATDGATIFVVGQYLPAGNISNPGYFEKNVLPSGSPVDIKSTTSGPAGGSGQAPGGLSIQPNKIPSHSGLAEKGSSENKNSSFEREFLQTHNTYRKQHGAPPLTINHDLCHSAQAWAENLLSIKTLKHSKADYGENLYYAWSSSPKKLTGHEAVDSWYSEIKDYNFKKPGFTSGTGHFTQVVWKDTKEVGFGLATDGAAIFVVGQYLPAGNITNPGYFEKNVLPAGSPVDLKSTNTGPVDGIGQALGGLSIQSNKTEQGDKSENLAQFPSQLLVAMNHYRQRHGVRPLSQCPVLSKEAKEWAAHLVSIKTLKNSKKAHGETMSYKWTSTLTAPTGEEVAEGWYKESSKYNFSTPTFQSGTGNFTQMVWKSSERAGVGIATDGKGLFITVAFYEPAGNITNPGYFQDNVTPAAK